MKTLFKVCGKHTIWAWALVSLFKVGLRLVWQRSKVGGMLLCRLGSEVVGRLYAGNSRIGVRDNSHVSFQEGFPWLGQTLVGYSRWSVISLVFRGLGEIGDIRKQF